MNLEKLAVVDPELTGYINEELLEEFKANELISKDYITRKDDIIVRLTTPYTAVLIDESSAGLVVPSHFIIIRAREEYVLPQYLCWFLNLDKVKLEIAKNIIRLQTTSEVISTLDVITSFATVAEDIERIIKDAVQRGVDGLFLPTYSLSAQVLTVMKKLGLRTPQDLAIVGFDESDIYSLYETTVSHIVQPLKELGEKSVEVLIDMIQGKEAQTIVLKPTLKLGGSTEKRK